MKKAIVLLALASMFSTSAHATKARVEALQGAVHLIDSQSIFTYTADIHQLGSYATFEFGPGAAGTTEPKAEGGLFRKSSDGSSIYGFYLGHHNEEQAAFRALNGLENQSNPVQAFYGQDNWAVTLGLSRTDEKSTETKETSVSLGFGQNFEDFSWGLNADVVSTAEQPNAPGKDEYNGSPSVVLNIRQHGQTYFHGGVSYSDTSFEDGATATKTDYKGLGAVVGFIDRTLGAEKTDLYYGVSLAYVTLEVGDKDIKTYQLPVVIGLEHALNSWATFRGSVQQNVLLGSTKDGTAAAPGDKEDTIGNNTNVSAGLGLNYGGLQLDGVLTMATSGDLNGNAFIARAGVIYNF